MDALLQHDADIVEVQITATLPRGIIANAREHVLNFTLADIHAQISQPAHGPSVDPDLQLLIHRVPPRRLLVTCPTLAVYPPCGHHYIR